MDNSINLFPYVLAAIGAYIFYKYLEFNKSRKFEKLIRSFSGEEFDYQDFVNKVDAEMDKNKAYKEYCKYLKAQVLVVRGYAAEATEIMNSLNTKRFNNDYRCALYYWMATALYQQGRGEEARKVIAGDPVISKVIKGSKDFKVYYSKLDAIDSFYSGKYEESNKALLEIKDAPMDAFSKAELYYYLGMVSGKLDNHSDMKKYYKDADGLVKGTYINKRIQEQKAQQSE